MRDHWPGAAPAGAQPLPFGAAMVDPAIGTAWVLAEGDSPRSLGAALAWAQRASAPSLHLLVDGPAAASGVMARRAQLFDGVAVWRVTGREVETAQPTPPDAGPPVPAEVAAQADRLRDHGVDPVVEHGVLMGEVLGLEVCRVVEDDDGGGLRLEVGVGRNDRKARALLLADGDVGVALDEVVATVRQWRRPGVRVHPANTLAVERWLRAVVVARPELVDAAFLAPVPPAVPRADLTHRAPATAAGEDVALCPVLAVCTTGIDLELGPAAADAWLADGREPALRLVLPDGDDHPVIHRMAASLRVDARVVTVPAGWKDLA